MFPYPSQRRRAGGSIGADASPRIHRCSEGGPASAAAEIDPVSCAPRGVKHPENSTPSAPRGLEAPREDGGTEADRGPELTVLSPPLGCGSKVRTPARYAAPIRAQSASSHRVSAFAQPDWKARWQAAFKAVAVGVELSGSFLTMGWLLCEPGPFNVSRQGTLPEADPGVSPAEPEKTKGRGTTTRKDLHSLSLALKGRRRGRTKTPPPRLPGLYLCGNVRWVVTRPRLRYCRKR